MTHQELEMQEIGKKISLRCVLCHKDFPWNKSHYRCDCPGKGLLAVRHHARFSAEYLENIQSRSRDLEFFNGSGVWRFYEAVLPIAPKDIISHPEGNTRIYRREALSAFAGINNLQFKHEGENPTGSFKDRGMTVAVSAAKALGAKVIACASTGNTSAALAAYAAHAGIPSVVFLPAGKIAMGKLSQAMAYGARCLAVRGDFDAAMALVAEASDQLGFYLVNSINPYRIEGQKTIIWELLQQLKWQVPDWIVVPAGNLGNTSAFGKALKEAFEWGWIDKMPRIAAVQARGANPFYMSYLNGFQELVATKAETIATAIQIGNPVNFMKAVESIRGTHGVVVDADDDAIMEAKQAIDGSGIGCEPASACTLAGIKTLVQNGVIEKSSHVVAVLTGNILKDTEIILKGSSSKANLNSRLAIKEIDPTIEAVAKALA